MAKPGFLSRLLGGANAAAGKTPRRAAAGKTKKGAAAGPAGIPLPKAATAAKAAAASKASAADKAAEAATIKAAETAATEAEAAAVKAATVKATAAVAAQAAAGHATPPKKAGPPYAMTPEREKLIGEAMRVREQTRQELGEERVAKLEAIVKRAGGL